jgi:hypothetical protein
MWARIMSAFKPLMSENEQFKKNENGMALGVDNSRKRELALAFQEFFELLKRPGSVGNLVFLLCIKLGKGFF